MIDLERSNRQRFGYEAISSHVEGIERIYSKSNIRITHQLFSLLNDAKDLAAQWAEGNIVETDMNKLFNSLHIERIYGGIKLLDGYDNREKYLKDLLNGTLDFFLREISHAKSIFWELEVFTKIKKVIPDTHLNEPDIVVDIGRYSIAIPCKKIFSEKGVPKETLIKSAQFNTSK